MNLDVLYEDNHLLVINKTASLPTMGTQSGCVSVHSLASDYIRKKYNKPGKVYLGVVSRLDSMSTGVLVLARTSKSASRLVPQFGNAQRTKKNADFVPASKVYLAAVDGALSKTSGTLQDHVYKDEASHRMRVAAPDGFSQENTQLARLSFERLGADSDTSLLAVKLDTGRKHQIRVQFASLGHALLGDRKYGSRRSFPAGVALHSWQTTITHPTRREPMTFTAPLPKSWSQVSHLLPPPSLLQQRSDSL